VYFIISFTQVAMVEISFDDHKHSKTSTPLIIIYSILTCLVVSVHLLALMISTCILSLLEAENVFDYKEHKTMHIYIEFAWILSTGFGEMFLKKLNSII
jgi:calcium release-activated calcium channel protein 1